jgi:hypothetical protein
MTTITQAHFDAQLNLIDSRNEISNLRESLAHADNRATEAERTLAHMQAELQGATFMGEPAPAPTLYTSSPDHGEEI